MITDQSKPESTDVPQTIFQQFIQDLRKTETPPSIVNELEKLIASGNPITDIILRAALTKNIEI